KFVSVVVSRLSDLGNLGDLGNLLPFEGDGFCVNSDFLNGLPTAQAKVKIMDYFEQKGWGKRVAHFKLRDWCISRQRYWGPPIPMIYCKKCAEKGEFFRHSGEEPKATTPESDLSAEALAKADSGCASHTRMTEKMPGWFPVPEADLPVLLPYIKDYKPTGDGKSPLARDGKFCKVKCPNCKGWAERETDVSDTFLDSAWYFLRYPSVGLNSKPQTLNSKQITNHKSQNDLGFRISNLEIPWDPQVTRHWLPVDMYIGGHEHAVLHLMYARFVTMALKDMGFIDFTEPFKRFFAHGLMTSEGFKMSKSRGNVVNPNQYLEKYGADTLRMYILFMGPYDAGSDFRMTGIAGMHRFLKKVWNLVNEAAVKTPREWAKHSPEVEESKKHLLSKMHQTIKKVGEDIAILHFNTAIASIMEYYNFLVEVTTKETIDGRKLKIGVEDRESKIEKETQSSNFYSQPLSSILRHPSSSYSFGLWQEALKTLLLLLAPFAPFMTEELYQALINADNNADKRRNSVDQRRYPRFSAINSIHNQTWPRYDTHFLQSDEVTIVVQVNGKVRDKINLKSQISNLKPEVEKLAWESEKVRRFLSGLPNHPGSFKKAIFVPGKLINFVL
ncbi:MAG: class I tRNA ligase family protein, partial [Patescibacteria group bacterium]|nr:class I tRNA ligase family protein [Patescibacteria group bacterium]